MQLITFLSAAAATVATASARSAVTLNKSCDKSQPHARIINRCDYPVNIWSVFKGDGCPAGQMVTLKKGESYSENYEKATQNNEEQGISIKISKTEECKGNDITQLEYYLDERPKTETGFQLNYHDVSFVDCLGQDCPGMKEGYYLQVGTQTVRSAKATTDNSWCPIQSCHDPVSCALISYILPDDVRTKTCDLKSSMDFYLCGSQAPSEDDDKPVPVLPSSKKADTPAPKPTTTAKAPATDNYKAAAVTPAAEIKGAAYEPKVKTKVVYVTAYEYVNAKRSEHGHAHAHARRHQAFHA